MNTLPVSEIFGPVFQGEGPHTGRACAFIRLGLCNLSCSWCDTPYTWDKTRYDIKKECPPLTADEIMAQLPKTNLLIVSGGEPLMHKNNDALKEVVFRFQGDIHVETNGTIIPSDWLNRRVNLWNVSPKLAHSGDPEKKRIKPLALAWFATAAQERRACFKFVAQHPDDLQQIKEFQETYHIPNYTIWVMPEGVTAQAQIDGLKLLSKPVVEQGWNISTRLQILTYGNTKGT